jgi:hypothetical protein
MDLKEIGTVYGTIQEESTTEIEKRGEEKGGEEKGGAG